MAKQHFLRHSSRIKRRSRSGNFGTFPRLLAKFLISTLQWEDLLIKVKFMMQPRHMLRKTSGHHYKDKTSSKLLLLKRLNSSLDKNGRVVWLLQPPRYHVSSHYQWNVFINFELFGSKSENYCSGRTILCVRGITPDGMYKWKYPA